MDCDQTFLYKEFVPLVHEYDEIFKSMEKQLCVYETEHKSFQKEIENLIKENKTLSKKLEDALEVKNNYLLTEHDKSLDEVINNLRTQLTITSQEKDTTSELWQNSLKIIDHLEAELKIYKGNKQGYVSKNELEKEKQKHAIEIKELQKKLKSTINHQESNNKNILQNLEFRGNELQVALEGQRTALNHVQEKNTEISELKQRLNSLLETCELLKDEIEKRDNLIRKLNIIDQDSRAKVLESVIITEAALFEKEAAAKREIEAKEEIKELSNTLSEIIKEADQKILAEKEVIKKQYNENLNKLMDDMKSIKNKLEDKELFVERITREKKMLEDEISRLQKGNVIIDDNSTSKLLILEKNLESTFQKLLISERRLMQTTSERDRTLIDLEQMTEKYERDRRTSEFDKQNLERKLKTLQKELSISNGYVEEYVLQIKELNARMVEMEQSMNDQIQRKDKMYEKIITEKINTIKSKNTAVQKEMETHLKSEHNLNKRWKTESKEILEKLENKIQELKSENNNLRIKIKNSKPNTVS